MLHSDIKEQAKYTYKSMDESQTIMPSKRGQVPKKIVHLYKVLEQAKQVFREK